MAWVFKCGSYTLFVGERHRREASGSMARDTARTHMLPMCF